jgi:inner membrane protein
VSIKDSVRNSVIFKMIFIGIIIVVLIIPLLLIRSVVNERMDRRYDAVFDVGSKWGSIQTITGPLLTIPYNVYYKDENDVVRSRKAYMQFLPDLVNITAHIETEIRRRGIFNVPVYSLQLQCDGLFSGIEVTKDTAEEDVLWDEIHLFVGVSDLRGIQQTVSITWDGEEYAFEPGAVVTNPCHRNLNLA